MISIIIPVHNAYEYTIQCIESIKENTVSDYEIVLIDNGSTDETKDIDVAIRLEENQGFAKAVNKGIEFSKGDYICLLNNDTITTPNWLEHMLWHIENNNLDIVGACSNYVSGNQMRNLDYYKNKIELNTISVKFHEDNKEQFELSDYVIGFCMLIRKSVFDKIGIFDEAFDLTGEEIDFCLRAKNEGFKTGIAKDVYIHHFGSVTFLNIGGIEYYKEICIMGDKKLTEKWGNCLG